MAVPKPCLSESSKLAEKQSSQYSHMYENYWSDKDAWGNYGAYQVCHMITFSHRRLLYGVIADPLILLLYLVFIVFLFIGQWFVQSAKCPSLNNCSILCWTSSCSTSFGCFFNRKLIGLGSFRAG